jgi:hypothetical protein
MLQGQGSSTFALIESRENDPKNPFNFGGSNWHGPSSPREVLPRRTLLSLGNLEVPRQSSWILGTTLDLVLRIPKLDFGSCRFYPCVASKRILDHGAMVIAETHFLGSLELRDARRCHIRRCRYDYRSAVGGVTRSGIRCECQSILVYKASASVADRVPSRLLRRPRHA